MNLFDERIRALEALGKRVRAMMWSSPTCNTGTMLSIADLMGVVKAHGLISIVDVPTCRARRARHRPAGRCHVGSLAQDLTIRGRKKKSAGSDSRALRPGEGDSRQNRWRMPTPKLLPLVCAVMRSFISIA
ncbi:hypothetical protein I4I83_12795 [Acidovorax cattleyae]|nr:hypothetical protein [Paracidovorax cattleyae]